MLAQIFDADAADETTDEHTQAVPDMSLDMIFEVLRNERRRYALRHLATVEDEVAFGDLVDQVAAEEHDAELGAVDSGTRKAVYTSLYQSHLPKLEDMGVISYDGQSGPVSAGPHMEEVLECLDAVLAVRGEEETGGVSAKKGLDSLRSAIKV